jgi:manganese/iron transport system substrate-binding protein
MSVRRPTVVRPWLRLDIRIVLVALLVAALTAACGNSAEPGTSTAVGPTAEGNAVRVVATTTVLADMVRQAGGTRVSVTSLVPPGGEVHTFDPTPSDLAAVADADLVVMNGLGLDDWLATIVADSGTDATLVRLGEDLDGVEYLAGEEGEAVNPHLWLDVEYGMRYVERIGEALESADPANADAYERGASDYLARLEELDRWATEQLGAIPEADRRIVSFHEAFPYFAAAYGLEIVGTVVDAPGQDPSAGEIASLVEAIRASGARAVFSEAQFDPELAETVAREAGVTVERNLYNDSLGEPPADTYEGLIRWDVERVVEALTR